MEIKANKIYLFFSKKIKHFSESLKGVRKYMTQIVNKKTIT
ncbi:hypothetical protein P262_05213 [Cronobacter malonaticus]|uniref:Uncharacterized protein n=1 Tax=Cronobacter malonaticus TaxID=413503 RepID=V5U4L4_9ENTR|nr:hypothetical protein P262_05213 [Cronobacter malonaticus]